ncbi:MAG TPA: HD domain-containing protein [Thermoanaerobaculia bacterium]|nr:HD domain-containing protein [Thermoanaerobaculia bacterium]
MIRDAVAVKRVIKWGYVRQFGGLYPAECDSVAAHSGSVGALAVLLAAEYRSVIQAACGVTIDIEEVALMALFHDYGEGRSGDTGASSYSVRGFCNLHPLEREGLVASLSGLQFEDRALQLWDDYRAYRTPEAIVVHIADNLEGMEKALHCARGSKEVVTDSFRIFEENLQIYESRKDVDDKLGAVANFLVKNVLLPGRILLADAYGAQIQHA